jgi:taurine dioxygenase
MSSIQVNPLREDLPFGARIPGLTEKILQDQSIVAEIRRVFEDRGMIVFEGVEPSDRMQIALSKAIGPLKDHPVTSVDRVDDDELRGAIRVVADPDYADIVEIDGKPYSSWLPWHFDHCYNNELNRAGVLRLVQITPNGGQTCFMDGIELYRRFPAELLERISACSILYSLDMQPDHIRFGRPENFRVLQVDPPGGMDPAEWRESPAYLALDGGRDRGPGRAARGRIARSSSARDHPDRRGQCLCA